MRPWEDRTRSSNGRKRDSLPKTCFTSAKKVINYKVNYSIKHLSNTIPTMLPIDPTKLGSYFVYHQNDPLTFVTPFFLVLFTAFFVGFLLVHRHHRSKIIYLTLFSLFFYYKSSGLNFMLLLVSAI